jgi:DME family drug/metabolite transporter
LLGIGALAIAGYQVCFFSAVRLTGVAIGTVVAIGSGPVFAGLISALTGAARPSARWVIATAVAITGCTVLLAGGRAAGAVPGGAGLALLAGLCYACYAVAAGRLIAAGSAGRAVMATMFGGGGLLLLPVLLAGHPGWLLSVRGVAVIGELSVFATAVAYLLYGLGLRSVQVPVAVTLGLTEPAVAALLAVAVLGERLTARAVAGLLLVGFALVLLAIPRRACASQGGQRVVENHERGSPERTDARVRRWLRLLRWPAQRRQVDADERAGRQQGLDHEQPAADD